MPLNGFSELFCDPALRRNLSEARPRARRGGPERTMREENEGGEEEEREEEKFTRLPCSLATGWSSLERARDEKFTPNPR